jgi:DNA-directed RNA polymerase subunit delta
MKIMDSLDSSVQKPLYRKEVCDMSSTYQLKFSVEKAKEMPMVDLAFEILKSAHETFFYRDLMMEIAKIKGLTESEVMDVIAQLYTEIIIDGRFACVGKNLWGLKRWYPVEKGEDGTVGGTKYPKIINDDHDDDEDDIFVEEEEEAFAGEEDFDTFDEDAEEFESEEEEEEEKFFDEDSDAEEELDDADVPDVILEDDEEDLLLDEDEDEEEEEK